MPILHSVHAPVSLRHPTAWKICDRCGFRYSIPKTTWQYDWRGNQLQNLWLIVCPRCDDVPQPQLRPIIIGPDPVPVKDPRPGWSATQMGFTPAFTVTEILSDPYPPFGTPGGPSGLLSNGGVVQLTSLQSGWQTTPAGLAAGAVWSNGLVVTIVAPTTPSPTAPPVYFSGLTAAALLALGAPNLPKTGYSPGSGQLINNGYVVMVA